MSTACIEFKKPPTRELTESFSFLKKEIHKKPEDKELWKRGLSPEELDRIKRYTIDFGLVFNSYFEKLALVEQVTISDNPQSLSPGSSDENMHCFSRKRLRESLPRKCKLLASGLKPSASSVAKACAYLQRPTL